MKKGAEAEPSPKPTVKQIIVKFPGIDYVEPADPEDLDTNLFAKIALEVKLAWDKHLGSPPPGQGGSG